MTATGTMRRIERALKGSTARLMLRRRARGLKEARASREHVRRLPRTRVASVGLAMGEESGLGRQGPVFAGQGFRQRDRRRLVGVAMMNGHVRRRARTQPTARNECVATRTVPILRRRARQPWSGHAPTTGRWSSRIRRRRNRRCHAGNSRPSLSRAPSGRQRRATGVP